MKRRSLLTLSAAVIAGSLTVSGMALANAKDYVLNTASTGGTYPGRNSDRDPVES